MIDWIARAAAQFSQPGATPTDETDERGISSVSSVPAPGAFETREGVSSVSSVPTLASSEKREVDFDSRVTCTTCAHYRPAQQRCMNQRTAMLWSAEVGPALAALPQNCPGFRPSARARS